MTSSDNLDLASSCRSSKVFRNRRWWTQVSKSWVLSLVVNIVLTATVTASGLCARGPLVGRRRERVRFSQVCIKRLLCTQLSVLENEHWNDHIWQAFQGRLASLPEQTLLPSVFSNKVSLLWMRQASLEYLEKNTWQNGKTQFLRCNSFFFFLQSLIYFFLTLLPVDGGGDIEIEITRPDPGQTSGRPEAE